MTPGGLPIERDCRKETLQIGDHELVQVVLPLCSWLKGLADGLTGEGVVKTAVLVVQLSDIRIGIDISHVGSRQCS